jgi:hypothetical protein
MSITSLSLRGEEPGSWVWRKWARERGSSGEWRIEDLVTVSSGGATVVVNLAE